MHSALLNCYCGFETPDELCYDMCELQASWIWPQSEALSRYLYEQKNIAMRHYSNIQHAESEHIRKLKI